MIKTQLTRETNHCIVYFGDATYQALAYWIMGAISNDPFTLARFTGFYKAIQSAGGAGSFGMDATSTPFLNELLASWLMMMASYTEEKTVYARDVVDEKALRSTDNKLGVVMEDEK